MLSLKSRRGYGREAWNESGGEMEDNARLKKLLMQQSFLPLVMLLTIKNYDAAVIGLIPKFISAFGQDWRSAMCRAAVHESFPVLLFLCGCLFWIVKGMLAVFQFHEVQTSGFCEEDTLKITNYTADSGLNFFMTFIVALLIDDIKSIRGVILYLVILYMVWMLIRHTNLYYQNPVLAMLGYRVIEFYFTDETGKETTNYPMFGLARKGIDENRVIRYQKIADNVFIVCNK